MLEILYVIILLELELVFLIFICVIISFGLEDFEMLIMLILLEDKKLIRIMGGLFSKFLTVILTMYWDIVGCCFRFVVLILILYILFVLYIKFFIIRIFLLVLLIVKILFISFRFDWVGLKWYLILVFFFLFVLEVDILSIDVFFLIFFLIFVLYIFCVKIGELLLSFVIFIVIDKVFELGFSFSL